MYILNLNGTEIHSLPELREHFDRKNGHGGFPWRHLVQICCYEQRAEALAQPKYSPLPDFINRLIKPMWGEKEAGAEHQELTLSPAKERKICRILGVAYEEADGLTQEQ